MPLPKAVEDRLLALWASGAEATDVYPGAVRNFLPKVELSPDGECWLWNGTLHAEREAPEFTWTWPSGRQGNRRPPKLIFELIQKEHDPKRIVVQNEICHGGRYCPVSYTHLR